MGFSYTTTRDQIPYDIMPEFRDSYNEGQRVLEQVVRVKWDESYRFLLAIMPDVFYDPPGAAASHTEVLELGLWGGLPNQGQLASVTRNVMRRLKPQAHPAYPQMYAVDYEILGGIGFPVKNNDGSPGYKTWSGKFGVYEKADGQAKIKVRWKSLPYLVEVSDDYTNAFGRSELSRYCSIKPSYAGQNLELTGTRLEKLRFDGSMTDGTTTNAPQQWPFPIRRPFPESHVKITWHMVPTIPQCISMFEGRVNATSMTFFDPSRLYRKTFRPGTLLFLTAEISEPYWTFGGTRVVDITYHFLHRDHQAGPRNFGIGHNFLFSAADHQFYRVAFANATGNFQQGTLQFTGPVNDNPWPPATRVLSPGFQTRFVGGGNIHDYVEMSNLFKLDDDTITYR